MDTRTQQEIAFLQTVSARRYDWTVDDRIDYMFHAKWGQPEQAHDRLKEFNSWSAEHYEYNTKAMRLMGITDADQEYA